MQEKGRRIIAAVIAAAGLIELAMAISEGAHSAMLLGVCFCLIGGMYLWGRKQ